MIIKLPHLGDGINSATVLSIFIKPGDKIEKNQTILELETDKATAPIPASESGVVDKILVKEGDTVSAGTPVVALVSGGDVSPPVSASPSAATPVHAVAAVTPQAMSLPSAPLPVSSGKEVVTSPSIRKTARELGIDLTRVTGSEHGGRIVLEDVKAYIHALQSHVCSAVSAPAIPAASASAPAIDFSKWGDITLKPISSLRKKIGQKMSESWTTVPHVTQFEDADITALMEVRKAYNTKHPEAKLTLTVFALKILVKTLKKFPHFNASLDSDGQNLILKNYYHIGVAVDTENGLIVPVIKDVDKKSLIDLSSELNTLAEKARKRQIGLEDLQGGSFTLSNLGGLGVSHFTPIINTPEVAILALGAGRLKPVIYNKELATRMIMPMGLSYDHRIIDGADGARFIRELVAGFENPQNTHDFH